MKTSCKSHSRRGGSFQSILVFSTALLSISRIGSAAKLGLTSYDYTDSTHSRIVFPSNNRIDNHNVDSNLNSKPASATKTVNVGFTVSLYPWNDHIGRELPLGWNDEQLESRHCQGLPPRWFGKVRSIDTKGNCVVLFARDGCTGPSRVVKPGSPSHNRLSDICFHRRTKSVRPCNEKENLMY